MRKITNRIMLAFRNEWPWAILGLLFGAALGLLCSCATQNQVTFPVSPMEYVP